MRAQALENIPWVRHDHNINDGTTKTPYLIGYQVLEKLAPFETVIDLRQAAKDNDDNILGLWLHMYQFVGLEPRNRTD